MDMQAYMLVVLLGCEVKVAEGIRVHLSLCAMLQFSFIFLSPFCAVIVALTDNAFAFL